jgi:hypothetical protein
MQDNQIIHVDGYTKFCLTAIVILLSALVVGLWVTGPAGTVPTAQAGPDSSRQPYPPPVPVVVLQSGDVSAANGIPDAGMQRLAALNAALETNAKLERMLALLESGKLHVIADSPEKGSSDAASPRR